LISPGLTARIGRGGRLGDHDRGGSSAHTTSDPPRSRNSQVSPDGRTPAGRIFGRTLTEWTSRDGPSPGRTFNGGGTGRKAAPGTPDAPPHPIGAARPQGRRARGRRARGRRARGRTAAPARAMAGTGTHGRIRRGRTPAAGTPSTTTAHCQGATRRHAGTPARPHAGTPARPHAAHPLRGQTRHAARRRSGYAKAPARYAGRTAGPRLAKAGQRAGAGLSCG
jgi:hypothetical protein